MKTLNFTLLITFGFLLTNCSPAQFANIGSSQKISSGDNNEATPQPAEGDQSSQGAQDNTQDSSNSNTNPNTDSSNNTGGSTTPPVNVSNPNTGTVTTPTTPTAPSTPSTPVAKVSKCDVLIDQSGVYFNAGDVVGGYVAVTGVTECAFNEINKISGPCDSSKNVTILKPEDVPGVDNNDLQLNPKNPITIVPTQDSAIFLCISFSGKAVISAMNTKVIIVGR